MDFPSGRTSSTGYLHNLITRSIISRETTSEGSSRYSFDETGRRVREMTKSIWKKYHDLGVGIQTMSRTHRHTRTRTNLREGVFSAQRILLLYNRRVPSVLYE